ncbi:helix-turn-helix domain-containing protein [Noviherbaspirillum humi]|uniref:helix-turn-helix domain-containing protein n=1 Tax=Noviherbaspirillum humi TaxID=1688639 RepID=UPI001FE9F28A|nr:helix-turn-helix transcriptional regulator [Noviherbaspirillum humi]
MLDRNLAEISQLTGMPASHISTILNGRKDAQASTLEALASAMDAKWMLIPRHLLPEVERLLAGKAVGPDDVPSTIDRLFNQDGHE